jgi:deoxyadenosine/deoxycytidine kinase
MEPGYEEILHKLKGNVVTVDGVVGAGKSTFCQRMATLLALSGIKCIVHQEYLSASYLGLLLNNRPRYTFGFQVFMLAKRMETYRTALGQIAADTVILIDRSLYGDWAFASLALDMGYINNEEYQVYMGLLKEVLIDCKLGGPHLPIYLSVPPSVAMYRIEDRNRSLEPTSYDTTFLDNLDVHHKYHFEGNTVLYLNNDTGLDAIAQLCSMLDDIHCVVKGA